MRVSVARQRRACGLDGKLAQLGVKALPALLRSAEAVKVGHEVRIGSRGGKKARKRRVAHTELRVARVQVRPPLTKPSCAPLEAWAVQVLEPEPPPGCNALNWLLLSSDGGRPRRMPSGWSAGTRRAGA